MPIRLPKRPRTEGNFEWAKDVVAAVVNLAKGIKAPAILFALCLAILAWSLAFVPGAKLADWGNVALPIGALALVLQMVVDVLGPRAESRARHLDDLETVNDIDELDNMQVSEPVKDEIRAAMGPHGMTFRYHGRQGKSEYVHAALRALVKLVQQDKQGGLNRRLRVHFIDSVSEETTVKDFVRRNAEVDLTILTQLIQNTVDWLLANPGGETMSVRELLKEVSSPYVDELKRNLAARLLLNPEDIQAREEGPLVKPEYGGVYPPFRSETLSTIGTLQLDIQEYGAEIARISHSPTHIVLSAFARTGEGYSMVITATETDKSEGELLVPSHTPVVERKGEDYVYYGDQGKKPSHEMVSHWHLHRRLVESDLESLCECQFICHCHSDHVLRLATEESMVTLDDGCHVQVIRWRRKGTPALGESMADAFGELADCDKSAVLVLDHGVWCIGPSFSKAYDQMRHVVGLAARGRARTAD